ncbi:MAG: hypothetical protein IIY60_07930 [Clostridia bacterium]|nr:hypothetical protein [Clostridia bacterium]
MLKKKTICLALVLCCALVLTACAQQATYPNQPKQDSASQSSTEQQPVTGQADMSAASEAAPAQQINFNDGSYDPASEEGGKSEQIGDTAQNAPAVTNAPMMQSEFAGATPVKIDPVDKPTPTPLPKITFSYTTYNAPNLHLTFEGPAGWIADDLAADTYILTNPDPSMDYEAKAEIRTIAAGKDYTQKELVKEAKAQAEALQGTGSFQSFSTSDTATRTFINGNGVYIAYKGTLNDGQETGVAGRIIVNTVNKVLYVLHVSYPRGLADTFADGVYNKIRHSMKLTN